jgi:hypothetical protein
MSYNDFIELLCYYDELKQERIRLYDRYMNDEIDEFVLESFEQEINYVESALSHYKTNN